MRTHTKKLSAIGTAIGLVLMASAITPAVAASSTNTATAAATSFTSCASFKGATVVGSYVQVSALPLKAGDTIYTNVSPARTGDMIMFQNAGTLYAGVPSTSGHTFRAPADGLYYPAWSLNTSANGGPPSTITWSFNATCSSSTVVSPTPTPTPTATTKPSKGGGGGKGGGKGR